MEILRKMEANYREKVKDKEAEVWYKHKRKTSQMKTYKGVYNRPDEILEDIRKEGFNGCVGCAQCN